MIYKFEIGFEIVFFIGVFQDKDFSYITFLDVEKLLCIVEISKLLKD